jgi:hypothetical protein
VQPDAAGRSTQREGDLELPLPEIVQLGDSGGPVFYHTAGQTNIDLVGIVVGQFSERARGNLNRPVMGVSTLQHIAEELEDETGYVLWVSQ